MPAFPKSFISIDDEVARIRRHFGADLERPCLIVGNGPSAQDPNLSREEIDAHVLIRMNWFFLEDRMTYGNRVDAFLSSVDNRGLREALELNAQSGRYDIRARFQPHMSSDDTGIRARQVDGHAAVEFDHWAVIATCPELARTMMSRPLPTQGMQAVALAAILGFKTVRLSGVDMYGSPLKRYSWSVPDSARAFLKDKDLKPGYEPSHDIDRDLRFLETVRAKYDFELLPASDMEVLEKSGVFDRTFSVATKSRSLAAKAPATPAGRRYAYVTHADGRYGLGAIALARSLERHSDHKLIVLHSDEFAPHYLSHVPNVELRHVDRIMNPSREGQSRFSATYTKLRVFEIEGYDRLTFIDSDAVVLQPIDDLFEASGFCAAPDLGLEPVPAKRSFNSGVFSFDTARTDFAHILNSSLSFQSDDGGDQGFLNKYFEGEVTYLPVAYNTLKRALVYHPELISISDVKVLHYVGAVKPWDVIGTYEREYLHMNAHWATQLTDEDWRKVYFATIHFASRRVDKKAFEGLQTQYAQEVAETEARYAEMFPDARASFGRFLDAAREAAADGNLSLAVYLYACALRENAGSTNAMLELAGVYEAMADKGSAIAVLDRAADLRPDRAEIGEARSALVERS